MIVSKVAPTWPWPPALKLSVGVHLAAGVLGALQPHLWPWLVGSVALNHVGLSVVGLWPRSRLLGPNITRLPDSAGHSLALTLDDGPDPHVTPWVLDRLDADRIKATFFLIACKARTYPSLVREIVARGHDVQNHSHLHRHNFSMLGPRALLNEIHTAQQILADLTGTTPHCFRAPAGLRNPFLDPVLYRLNLHLVSWTCRGFDTRVTDPSRVWARLSKALEASSILLLHDGNSALTPEGSPVVQRVLPLVLEAIKTRGLEAVTLRDVLPRRRLVPQGEPTPELGSSLAAGLLDRSNKTFSDRDSKRWE
jgi:peptidoglycan/xylan/chitin deacetylase (PgdA/CDA1 family)